MRFFVDKNLVETDLRVYRFASPGQAERFVNCLMTENEVYCSLIICPVKAFDKPTAFPFSLYGQMNRMLRHLPAFVTRFLSLRPRGVQKQPVHR